MWGLYIFRSVYVCIGFAREICLRAEIFRGEFLLPSKKVYFRRGKPTNAAFRRPRVNRTIASLNASSTIRFYVDYTLDRTTNLRSGPFLIMSKSIPYRPYRLADPRE